MLHLILLSLALVILAWILPWRRLRVWRAAIILLVALSIPFIAYEYQGFSDALKTKQALKQFDAQPNEENLETAQLYLQKHLAYHVEDGLAHVLSGRLYFAAQDYKEASDAFATAYQQYQSDEDLWVEYAAALLLSGHNPEQLNAIMQKIKKVDKPSTAAQALLAITIETEHSYHE
jgi:cytochrome c-type biogenesis protein CcmH/NrfG